MSKGHTFLAQNSDIDYVRQAYALALSIKINNKENNQTCLITNDEVPENYKHAFDYIVPIPWKDAARNSQWKIENRWKVIHATPFEENLVYDTDMILLTSNDHWWNVFQDKDLYFTTKVKTYRDEEVTSTYYRKVFVENNLDNIYTGCYYFRKVSKSFEFFKWVEYIFKNWNQFQDQFLKGKGQKTCSLDLSAALALKFMDYKVDNSLITFTHMKPHVQGWNVVYPNWTKLLENYLDDELNLNVGNFYQTGLFHYVEDDFLKSSHIKTLEKIYGIKE